jgi:opacity protein-like surface antigen
MLVSKSEFSIKKIIMFAITNNKIMKKLALSTLLTLGFIVASNAQGKGDVEFGVNVGYNSSTVTVSNSIFQPDSGSGVNFGVAADYFFSEDWSIKGKLIYDQKGWNNIGYVNGNIFYNTNYNLNYITIPVMANWHFGRTSNWNLNFGPYAGFLMSAKETRGGLDIKDGFNKNDFGLAFGIGVKIPVSPKLKINIEYEAQSGLSNAFTTDNPDQIYNVRGAFNVGINFLMK